MKSLLGCLCLAPRAEQDSEAGVCNLKHTLDGFTSLGKVSKRPSSNGQKTSSEGAGADCFVKLDFALTELKVIIGCLTNTRGSCIEQLQTALRILREKLDVTFVSVAGLSVNGSTYTILAAKGFGSDLCNIGIPQPVACKDAQHTVRRGLQQGASVVEILSAGNLQSACVPEEWRVMHRLYGVTTFAVVPILRGKDVVGVMTLGAKAPRAGMPDDRWLSMLEILSLWLSQWFENGQLANFCQLLEDVSHATNIDTLVKITARGLVRLCASKLHLNLHSRVALLRSDSLSAIIFEDTTPSRQTSCMSDDAVVTSARSNRRSSSILQPDSRRGSYCPSDEGSKHFRGARLTSLSYRRMSAVSYTSERTDSNSSMQYMLPQGQTSPSRESGAPVSSEMLNHLNAQVNSGTHAEYQVVGHSILLHGTILGEVLAQGRGTWIADCTTHFQKNNLPTRDIFLSANSHKTNSMVVAVINSRVKNKPLLGVYMNSPSSLSIAILQVLLKDVNEALEMLLPIFQHKLESELTDEWRFLHDDVLDPEAIISGVHAPAVLPATTGLKALSGIGSGIKDLDSGSAAAAEWVLNGSLSKKVVGVSKSPSFTVAGINPRQMAPLIAGLQDKLHTLQVSTAHSHSAAWPDDLMSVELLERIGCGGFGTVYRGLYNGVEVAVKLVVERDGDREHMRDAVELAVLSTLSHPNILQVMSYFTDVAVITPRRPYGPRHRPSQTSGSSGGGASPGAAAVTAAAGGTTHFAPGSPLQQPLRLLPASEVGPGQPRALAICMEFCDRGSLAEAIRDGAFKQPIDGGYGATEPALFNIYSTLLEIALALRHLHTLQLVHCDVKPSNVLLRSSLADPRGFTAKLSDFGLVKMINPDLGHPTELSQNGNRTHRFSGTVTHLPPELLAGTGRVDFSVDIYAFGIIMWEIMTGAPLYLGLDTNDICTRVAQDALRPDFPTWFPASYRMLAQDCWAEEPEMRPTAEELVQILNEHMAELNITSKHRQRRHSSYCPVPTLPQRRSVSARNRSKSFNNSFPLHIL